jgi:hypothetical protein
MHREAVVAAEHAGSGEEAEAGSGNEVSWPSDDDDVDDASAPQATTASARIPHPVRTRAPGATCAPAAAQREARRNSGRQANSRAAIMIVLSCGAAGSPIARAGAARRFTAAP